MDIFLFPFIGGTLIGLSALVYLLCLGRVAGISGILSNALFSKVRLSPNLFIVGLIIGGASYGNLTEQTALLPDTRSPILLIASGLLVGYGTRLGSGCTSGHGVCGISRLSGRSIIATVIFMVTAIMTVFISSLI